MYSSLTNVPGLEVEDVSRAAACIDPQALDADAHFRSVMVAGGMRFVERR